MSGDDDGSRPPPTILLAGARGLIGRRIAALMAHWIPTARLIGATRHPLATPPQFTTATAAAATTIPARWRTVDIFSPASLLDGLADVDVFVNAVGPYRYDPAPVLEACRTANVHYIDVAETPEFLARAEAVTAKWERPSSAVIAGCSTVPALVQALAWGWRDEMEKIVRLDVALSMGSNNPVGPTLLESLLAPLGQRSRIDGQRYFRRVAHRIRGADFSRITARYPSPVEGHGLNLGAGCRLPMRFYVGFDRAIFVYGLIAASWMIPLLSARTLRRLCRWMAPLAGLAGRCVGTRHGVLTLQGIDSAGRVCRRIEVHAFAEGLNVPALPAVWAARALLADRAGAASVGGWTEFPTVVFPADVVQWLRDAGCDVRLDPPSVVVE